MGILKRGNNRIVQNLTERDALFKVHNMEVFVVDATGDPNATSPATYVWDSNNTQWILTAGKIFLESDDESLDTTQEIVDRLKAAENTLATATLNTLNDVDTTGVQTGDFLEYNGTQWTPKTPPTGWKDNISPLIVSETGDPETSPIFLDVGNGLWSYAFASDKINEAFIQFHINHDIKPGTLVYPHIHWAPLSYSTGVVRFELDYTVAKGHQQNEYFLGTPTQIILEPTAKGAVGEHMLTETLIGQAIPAPEPDSLIRMRLRRNGPHANDTFYGSIVVFFVDLHYESNTDSTLNKAPNFYV